MDVDDLAPGGARRQATQVVGRAPGSTPSRRGSPRPWWRSRGRSTGSRAGWRRRIPGSARAGGGPRPERLGQGVELTLEPADAAALAVPGAVHDGDLPVVHLDRAAQDVSAALADRRSRSLAARMTSSSCHELVATHCPVSRSTSAERPTHPYLSGPAGARPRSGRTRCLHRRGRAARGTWWNVRTRRIPLPEARCPVRHRRIPPAYSARRGAARPAEVPAGVPGDGRSGPAAALPAGGARWCHRVMWAMRADAAFDGERLVAGGVTILVEGSTIVAVEPGSYDVPSDCPLTDHGRATVLPGSSMPTSTSWPTAARWRSTGWRRTPTPSWTRW